MYTIGALFNNDTAKEAVPLRVPLMAFVEPEILQPPHPIRDMTQLDEFATDFDDKDMGFRLREVLMMRLLYNLDYRASQRHHPRSPQSEPTSELKVRWCVAPYRLLAEDKGFSATATDNDRNEFVFALMQLYQLHAPEVLLLLADALLLLQAGLPPNNVETLLADYSFETRSDYGIFDHALSVLSGRAPHWRVTDDIEMTASEIEAFSRRHSLALPALDSPEAERIIREDIADIPERREYLA